jgi:hypothetical protein
MRAMLRLAGPLGLAILMAALPALALERPRLMEIPLEMPLEEELDGEYLEGIYQEKLLPELVDSVLYEAPIARIESTFSKERKLKIWFTSVEDGRRAYWLQFDQAFPVAEPVATQTLRDDFAKRYGQPDLVVGKISEGSGPVVVLRVDPGLEEPRRSAILQVLNESFQPDGSTLSDFWHMDMRQRARLLGVDFRGIILSYYENDGKTSAMTLELLDLALARSVLNLAPQ